jgi:hypothetical protein
MIGTVGAKLFKGIIPANVLAECRELAESAEMQRKEEIRTTASVVAFVAIAALWLVTAITASALMMKYLRR